MKSKLVLLLCLSVVAFTASVFAADGTDPIIVFFYEEGCSSCAEMEDLLAGMTIDLPDSAIARYEIQDPESQDMLVALSKAYDTELPTVVPVVFVGDDVVVGMGRAQEFALRNAIGDCITAGCESPIARLPISQWRADWPGLALLLTIFLGLAWLQLH
jgi:hypothetical protein